MKHEIPLMLKSGGGAIVNTSSGAGVIGIKASPAYTAANLHISPFREDGVTYGTPRWIWSVVVNDGLCVRGYNGQQSRWKSTSER